MDFEVNFSDEQIIIEELKAVQNESDFAILTRKYAKFDNALRDALDREDNRQTVTLESLKQIARNRIMQLVMESNGWKMIDGYWKGAKCEDE